MREEVLSNLGNKIRNKMQNVILPMTYNQKDMFETIKELSLLVSELLTDKKTKGEYIKRLKNSAYNSQDLEIKLETFTMFRNLLVHFPFFEKWEDVYITESLLLWNKNKSTILNYFEKHKSKEIDYKIFMRQYGEWTQVHEVKFLVPIISNNKTFLSEFISIEDLFWTFCLIDSLLEYIDIDVINFSYYSA